MGSGPARCGGLATEARARRSTAALALSLLGLAACRDATRDGAPGDAAQRGAELRVAPRTTAVLEAGAPADGSAPASDAGAAGAMNDAGDAAGEPETGAAPYGMLRVPGGTFSMGADRGGEGDERPKHAVTLASFWLDETEVTNEAYGECVRAGACSAPDARSAAANHAGKDEMFRRPRQPVVGVSWDDARRYCDFRGKRLPREAEWERAARGDDERRFPWGNDEPTPEHAVFGRALGGGATDEVGTHPRGRGPYGHLDLAGNVWEWMHDEYDPLAYTRQTAARGEPAPCAEILKAQDELRRDGKQGFTGSNPIPTICERVLRGGAFNYDGPGLRVTNRVHHPATFRLVMAGFRCAKDP